MKHPVYINIVGNSEFHSKSSSLARPVTIILPDE